MVKKIIISLLVCFSLTACMPQVAIKEKVVEKDIPVFVVPKAPKVDKPVLEISKLSTDDRKNINKEVKALAITVQQLINYSTGLETIINKYNEMSNTSVFVTDFNPQTPALLNIDKLIEFIKQH